MTTSSRRTVSQNRAARAREAEGSLKALAGAISGLGAELTTINTSVAAVTTALNDPAQEVIAIPSGGVSGREVVQKFGRSASIGTSYAPLSLADKYQMPQAASATALRIAAGGNANDTAAGSGAREVTFQGLDETGALIEEAVATAGASASSATTATFMRLFRAWVSSSGTYADGHTTFSQGAAISVENSGGGTAWGDIDTTAGQTQIGCYSVPLGKTAYVSHAVVKVASTKAVSVRFMQRRDILDSAAPYEAWRLIGEYVSISDRMDVSPVTAFGPFPALTDLVWFAKVASGTGDASVDFEIILEAT